MIPGFGCPDQPFRTGGGCNLRSSYHHTGREDAALAPEIIVVFPCVMRWAKVTSGDAVPSRIHSIRRRRMTPEEMKRKSRGFGTDMSGEAVAKRLDIVSSLRELGLALKKSRIIGPVSSKEERDGKQ